MPSEKSKEEQKWINHQLPWLLNLKRKMLEMICQR
jgi:hypothetical protein